MTRTDTSTITPDYTGTATYTPTVTNTAWVIIATNTFSWTPSNTRTVTETVTATPSISFTMTRTITPLICFYDNDQDGYGDESGITLIDNGDGMCLAADNESNTADDCNDSAASINPGAAEIPDDGVDQDCSGADTITCYVDADEDGRGNDAGNTVLAPDGACNSSQKESAANDDCDDSNVSIHPGAAEIPGNGIDENCDGSDALVCYADTDLDGYGDPGVSFLPGDGDCFDPGEASSGYDCDDTDASVHPEAVEIPDDGIDQNCNGNDDD